MRYVSHTNYGLRARSGERKPVDLLYEHILPSTQHFIPTLESSHLAFGF